MKIAFDIDAVLVLSTIDIVRFGLKDSQSSMSDKELLELMANFNLHDNFDGSKEYWNQKLRDYFATNQAYQLAPSESAIKAIAELASSHELVAITHRPKNNKVKVVGWIHEHFRDSFSEVELAGLLEEVTETKGQWCARNKVDVLIDDSYSNVLSANKEGLQGWLFGDYGWTNSIVDNEVVRVKSWEEVLQRLGKSSGS